MKTLDLTDGGGTLREVLDLAGEENLILTTPDGRRYVIAEIDDFDSEVRLVRDHRDLTPSASVPFVPQQGGARCQRSLGGEAVACPVA